MATRTVANGGGNWGSTGTWVEGAVPTSADNVVFTASSGQLTNAAGGVCLSIDCTNYTNNVPRNCISFKVVAKQEIEANPQQER